MPEVDVETIVDQLTLIGLVSRDQYREARSEAEDGSGDALLRVLLRKGWLTSWQVERLRKGDPSSFFFGNYRALFHLAEGTFARVYRGRHDESGDAVAIKVLRQRFANLPEAVMRFHKEAEAGMRLKHPNIVRVLDQGQVENRHFMIMEYVEGMNLREFLRHRIRLKDREAIGLMLGLAEGLRYSHDQGVTHRDLKATNILISNTGIAKLVDFGLATIEGDDTNSAIRSQRTVDYSALERTCGSPKGDPRSDIYFLGCVFYQMLTGQVPLEDSESKDPLKKMLKRSFGVIKPISEHRHAPDEELARIIERMMKMDLKLRYQTMETVVADLQAFRDRVAPAVVEGAASSPVPFPLELEEWNVEGSAEEGSPPASVFLPADQRPLLEEPVIEHPPEVAPPPPRVPLKNILCVEAQGEIQDALRKHLSRMGYRVLLVGDAEHAAERFREENVDLLIYDADGLGSEALVPLVQMRETAAELDRPFSAVVLLGPRQAALRSELASDDARLVVLSKPIKLKQVQEAVIGLIPPPRGDSQPRD